MKPRIINPSSRLVNDGWVRECNGILLGGEDNNDDRLKGMCQRFRNNNRVDETSCMPQLPKQ